MKKVLICLIFILSSACYAQKTVESFDSNSLEWNECASESNSGKSMIDKGVLTITSNGINKFMSAMAGRQVGENTYFTCTCYAPINVERPFQINTNVTIGKLDEDKMAGLIFNYKDDGNFYAFVFNEEEVRFLRYVDNHLVGSKVQAVKWQKKRKATQIWRLESDGNTINFFVDGMKIMNIRYMPLNYTGFGYYTFGKQKLIVDDVTFEQ